MFNIITINYNKKGKNHKRILILITIKGKKYVKFLRDIFRSRVIKCIRIKDDSVYIRTKEKNNKTKYLYKDTKIKNVTSILFNNKIRNKIKNMNIFKLEDVSKNKYNVPVSEVNKNTNNINSRYQNISDNEKKRKLQMYLKEIINSNNISKEKREILKKCFESNDKPIINRILTFCLWLDNNGFNDGKKEQEIANRYCDVAIVFSDKANSLFRLKPENALYYLDVIKEKDPITIIVLSKYFLGDNQSDDMIEALKAKDKISSMILDVVINTIKHLQPASFNKEHINEYKTDDTMKEALKRILKLENVNKR